MVYSDVINNKDFFLKKKDKYTMRDANALFINSLFKSYKGRTLTTQETKFICRCWAIHYDAAYSRAIATDEKQKVSAMF